MQFARSEIRIVRRRLSTWAILIASVFGFHGTPGAAEDAFEISLSDGQSISMQSEKARIVALEPSYLEVAAKDYLIRFTPRFIELEGSETTEEIRYRNTMIKLYRDVKGVRQEIYCDPNEDKPSGVASRGESNPDRVEITFEIEFERCRTLYTEETVEEDFVPLRIEGTVAGRPTRFD